MSNFSKNFSKNLFLNLLGPQAQTQLRVTEIFHSLQGESTRVGLPTVFIRLTGCPLRCQYCDTAYAFKGGTKLSIAEIMQIVSMYSTPYVCLTGGEPLAQPGCLDLLTLLADLGRKISLETSGALSIQDVDPRVKIILDIKTPDSQESHRNDWKNLEYLKPSDEIKFVICSPKDYEFSKQWVLQQLDKTMKLPCEILFSPSYQQQDVTELAEWILQDQLPVRLQIQLHKALWGNKTGV